MLQKLDDYADTTLKVKNNKNLCVSMHVMRELKEYQLLRDYVHLNQIKRE